MNATSSFFKVFLCEKCRKKASCLDYILSLFKKLVSPTKGLLNIDL